MSEMLYNTNKTINDYGEGIKKLLLDISEELKNDIRDGLCMRIASQKGDEGSIYNFIRNQGYEVNYKEFLTFYKDGLKMVTDNEEVLKSMLEEQKNEELSDIDLEQVAGGMSWWEQLLIGIGATLIIVALLILTAGIATFGIAAAAGGVATTATAAGMAGTAAAIATGVGVAGGAAIATALSV